MIAVITMQSVDGDCPCNITVDVDKLKAVTLEDCIEYYNQHNSDDATKLRRAKQRLKDAQTYVGIIEGTIDDGDADNNPHCWSILEEAKVELPQTVDWTDVIFYG